jgi:TolB-like protein
MSGEPTPLPPSTPDSSSAPAGIWQRVRQHKMLEWGLGYLGAALAIAHGAELLGHTFAWPETVQRLVMGLLIVGFPLALTIAWFHGHKGLQRVTAGELMVGSVLLIVGAVLLISLVRAPSESETKAGEHTSRAPAAVADPGAISLAVLPFVNLSADKDQEYFVDGPSEELLSQLAQVNGLRVVARTSSFAFKGRNEDLRVIAEKLGVNRVLEGSVRKAGDQLRITAELVNAADGSSIGSYNYDRRLDDVFKVQQEIAKDVAATLRVKLQGGDTSRPTGGTENIAAYDKYLLARSLAGRFDGASALKARQLYREALELDPRFALAWLGLHTTLYNLILLSAEDPQRADFAGVARQEMVEASAQIALLAPDAWWAKAMQWAETEGGLRSDARFKAIVRDMKVVDYWHATGNWGDFCRAEGPSGDFECH